MKSMADFYKYHGLGNDYIVIDPNKLNIVGGAIALGHPIGCSGTRIITTLAHQLRRTKQKFGVASMCIGGGQGLAMAIERL